MTSRSTGGATATLSYDLLDHLTQWYVSSSNQEQYLYDASGQRILRRSTSGSATTITTYPFGLEEHQYSGAGGNQGNTYYYSLAGRLLGKSDGTTTTFALLDGLGSVLASISNTAGSAAVKGNQLYGPYGNTRYQQGTLGTAKGFTGQYNDALTGLDYYNARYYDPVAGVFLSADKQQGNMQGMNPYAYVNGNPETRSDPSGLYTKGSGGETYYPGLPYYISAGGVAMSIEDDPKAGISVPYDGNGFDNGWRPGYGPDAIKPFNPPTANQLANWCSNHVKCASDVEYYRALKAEQENANPLLTLAFLTFLDDPEAWQQLTQGEQIVLQQLAEEEGINLDDAISAKLVSDRPSDQAEGEAGAIAQMYSKLIRFNYGYGPNNTWGEVDAETPQAIIEAKSGRVDIPNLIKQFNNRVINPEEKPFVIYAPGWNPKQVQTVYEQVGSLDTGQALYVTTSPEELITVLDYLQG